VGIRFISEFSRTVLALWVLKSSLSMSGKIRFMTPSVRGFFHSKNDIYDNAFDLHFDFLIVRGGIYKNNTSIDQPLTRRNLRGRGRCVDW
jgi:hypothetical protein